MRTRVSAILSFRHGRNRVIYMIIHFLRKLVPGWYIQRRKRELYALLETPRGEIIKERVNYYNRMSGECSVPGDAVTLGELNRRDFATIYYMDAFSYARYWSSTLKMKFLFGDVTEVPEVPSVVKSRPIGENNENAVLLKLNQLRHFVFVRDWKRFEEKKDILVGRGAVFPGQTVRNQFLEMYFDHPLCDIAMTNRKGPRGKYYKPRMSIEKQLDYKYVLCWEGNDVATNLKWVMSSNSIAVMPTPRYETWFMEGTLIPDVHYIHINEDLSNLEEKLKYYSENPEEAHRIITNAHAFIKQFRNKNEETLTALLVMGKYFSMTKQIDS